MRTITLSKAGIDLTLEPLPDHTGWFAVAGLDLDALEKVFILLEEPAMEAARKAADVEGGVHVMVIDEQVVASVPMDPQDGEY